jgi:hypothetical protein
MLNKGKIESKKVELKGKTIAYLYTNKHPKLVLLISLSITTALYYFELLFAIRESTFRIEN